jgi:glycosyltransferase involved in cell wall biosynthesis
VTHQPARIRPATTSRPLSIVIVSDHGWVNGGQSKVAIDSALALRSRGLDICFVASCGPLDERLQNAGIECHVLGDHDILTDPNRLRAAASGIWNRAAARLIHSCLAERDPLSTVVHVHGWAKGLSPSIGPVVTRAEAAHVYTLHEYFLACPNGGFFDYQAGELCTRRALGFDCLKTNCDSRGRTYKAWRVARQTALWAAGRMPSGLREVIYLAPKQRTVMEPYFPAEARWHLLPNPAGPQPRERIRAESNDLFLFVGRLSPEKGAHIAAAAAKLAGVRIAFCGEGEARDVVVGANPDAEMLGWVDDHELARWMARARCIVFPSLWYECNPLVVVDALRAGLPILISDSCVAASSIADTVSGLHVRVGDVQAWAEAMTRLSSNGLVESYSRAAFGAGQQLYGSDEWIAQLIGIYKAALARKHSERFAREFAS